jgi:hypothetical protein
MFYHDARSLLEFCFALSVGGRERSDARVASLAGELEERRRGRVGQSPRLDQWRADADIT